MSVFFGVMLRIKRIVLNNFKKFMHLDVEMCNNISILVGNNGAGKSTILQAIDLALSGSQYRVESAGLANLFNKDDRRFYQDNARRMYANKLAELCRSEHIDDIRARIEMFFDEVLVDEVQDFAGYDFNFLLELTKCKSNFVMFGGFYQHTFDTSRSGNTDANLYNDYVKYIKRFEECNVLVDTKSLNKCRRYQPTVCEFVANKLGIAIGSACSGNAEVRELNDDEIDRVINDDSAPKLFLQKTQNILKSAVRTIGETLRVLHMKVMCA